jgi:hypothetical protein
MLKDEYDLLLGSAKANCWNGTYSVFAIVKSMPWGSGRAEVVSIAAPGPSGPATLTAATPW